MVVRAKRTTKQPHYRVLITQTRLLATAIPLVLIFFIALSMIIVNYSQDEQPQTVVEQLPNPQVEIRPPFKIPTTPVQTGIPFKPTAGTEWQTVKIKAGDTLSTIFADLGIDQQTVRDIKLKSKMLGRLKPGQKLSLKLNSDNQLQRLEFKVSQRENLIITKVGKRYQATLEKIIPERSIKSAHIRIQHSLYMAAKHASISEKVILQLIDIFGWDIDFTRDIQPGDTLDIVYEAFSIDNEPAGIGNVMYAKIKNNGKIYAAVRYTNPKGVTHYYTPAGNSLHKAFLRTPVKYSHISSLFNLARFHPILHRIRAHRGVDYAAARGTPVKSAGDGTVVFTGQKGGYGNVVIIKHSDTYETLYAHLDHFAARMHPGKQVSQGDIIGYVGSTGLADGPHLHYEFHINGVHQNPLSAKIPRTLPLPKAYLADFRKKTKLLLAAANQRQLDND